MRAAGIGIGRVRFRRERGGGMAPNLRAQKGAERSVGRPGAAHRVGMGQAQ
jgi:hypothetical protein